MCNGEKTMYEEIYDIEHLRKDLCDYFGTAMINVSWLAITELTNVETASSDELINIALKNNFNLDKYLIKDNKFYR